MKLKFVTLTFLIMLPNSLLCNPLGKEVVREICRKIGDFTSRNPEQATKTIIESIRKSTPTTGEIREIFRVFSSYFTATQEEKEKAKEMSKDSASVVERLERARKANNPRATENASEFFEQVKKQWAYHSNRHGYLGCQYRKHLGPLSKSESLKQTLQGLDHYEDMPIPETTSDSELGETIESIASDMLRDAQSSMLDVEQNLRSLAEKLQTDFKVFTEVESILAEHIDTTDYLAHRHKDLFELGQLGRTMKQIGFASKGISDLRRKLDNPFDNSEILNEE